MIPKNEKKIWLFGLPEEANMGDQAQVICILRWLNLYYPDYHVYSYYSKFLNQDNALFLKLLKKYERVGSEDKICIQSGYNTTDIGIDWNGSTEVMHRNVVSIFRNTSILFLPQTIYFISSDEMSKSGQIYSEHPKLTFLTRGLRSFEIAKQMMPNVRLINSPDIVTTMIGDYKYNYKREGILLVKRAFDHQSGYNKQEIEEIQGKLGTIENTDRYDTTIYDPPTNYLDIREKMVEEMLDKFAHYKVIVTDRYHGAIFAMITGTPVVVLKTAIHKVSDGIDMFRGIADFDDYIFTCDKTEDLCDIVKLAIKKGANSQPSRYFKDHYFNSPFPSW